MLLSVMVKCPGLFLKSLYPAQLSQTGKYKSLSYWKLLLLLHMLHWE